MAFFSCSGQDQLVPSNDSELYSFPSRTLSDSPPPSTGWVGAMVGTTERATESASPSLGVRSFTFLIKQGQGVVRGQGRCPESLQTGNPGTQGPSQPFLPSGLLVCQSSVSTHPLREPTTYQNQTQNQQPRKMEFAGLY